MPPTKASIQIISGPGTLTVDDCNMEMGKLCVGYVRLLLQDARSFNQSLDLDTSFVPTLNPTSSWLV